MILKINSGQRAAVSPRILAAEIQSEVFGIFPALYRQSVWDIPKS